MYEFIDGYKFQTEFRPQVLLEGDHMRTIDNFWLDDFWYDHHSKTFIVGGPVQDYMPIWVETILKVGDPHLNYTWLSIQT
jgi:hypothetical protein